MKQENYSGNLIYSESKQFEIPKGTSSINIKNWSQSVLKVSYNGIRMDIAGMNSKGVNDFKSGDRIELENISIDASNCNYEIVFWL